MITEVDLSGTPCFAPGATLENLKKVNFIFGPNGTGKTSITRILSEGPDDDRITLADESSTREILVLNSKYIEETFQETENGIFFLGKQSIANQNDIESKKKDREKLSEEIELLKSKKGSAENEESKAKEALLSSIWSNRNIVPDQLSSCLDGYNRSRTKLRDKVKDIRQNPLPPEDVLPATLDELARQEKGLLTTTLETAPRVHAIPQIPQGLEDLPDLLRTPLIPAADSPLSELISQIRHSDWVRDGKHIMETHQNALSNRCPFCQQQTPQDFSENLAKLWDRSYDDAVARLQSRLATLELSVQQLSDFKSEIGKHQLKDVAEYSKNAQLDAIEKALSTSHTLLETKLEKQSQSFDAPEEWDIDAFNSTLRQLNEQVNTIVGDHNEKVNDQDNLKSEFQDKFWSIFSHHTCNDAFKAFDSIVGGETGTAAQIVALEEQIDEKDEKRKELTNLIKVADQSRMDIHPAIEHINRALSGIGMNSFELGASTDDFITGHLPNATQRDGYILLRTNKYGRKERTDVTTLSDGERNLICFLYFFHQFHKDTANTDKKFTVVIDDPVNAMDGLSSFITSGYIRELISEVLLLGKHKAHKYVDQLIILTHSTRFHMEAAYKIKKANANCAFYTIERLLSPADHDRHAKSVISGPFDDSKIHSEYVLLWEEVRRAWNILNSAPAYAKPTGDPRAQISPLIGNTMRRIIESYLIHLCGIGSITELGESSDAATRALMAFTNNNSHDAFDMDLHAVHNLTIDQLFYAFERVFIEHGAADHYNMMMRKGAATGVDA
jgi:hypothetical protein